MEVWGVTGVIGSGKTTACNYLKGKGLKVLDADQVSRLVVDKNTPTGKEGFVAIYKKFGGEVLDSLGNLDRGKLRKRIMVNPHERDELEAILHPLIVRYIQDQLRQWKEQGIKLGFVEGTRLVESGFHKMLAGLILVTASPDIRVKRIVKRDSMGVDEVKMMFGLQDESDMKMNSKVTWKNDKKEPDLYKQIDEFIGARKLTAL